MKLTITQRSEEASNSNDYRSAIKFVGEYDGNKVELVFSDGEPEDANIARDFNDVLRIEELVQMAYLAGKNGAEFTVESVDSDDL